MQKNSIHLVTRRSPLAMYQAHYISQCLTQHHPDLTVNITSLTTTGDEYLDANLSAIGGKGLFVKELEIAMLDGKADIAVHSMKDVPSQLPQGLGISAICNRTDPRDAFVSNRYAHFDDLPSGAIVGTTSFRRQCQLKAKRPDLQMQNLRGNVGTRLAKLDKNAYDAIILATAGLERLALQNRIRHIFSIQEMLPAVGQAALGVECREDDQTMKQLLKALNDPQTTLAVNTERAVNAKLGGDCRAPLAAHAQIDAEQLTLRALVGFPDGRQVLTAHHVGHVSDWQTIADSVAENLMTQGAITILEQCKQNP